MKDVTEILSAIEQGDVRAAKQLLPLVYDELRKLDDNEQSETRSRIPGRVEQLRPNSERCVQKGQKECDR